MKSSVGTVTRRVITGGLFQAKGRRRQQEGQSRPDIGVRGLDIDDTNKEMVAVLFQSETKDLEISTWENAFMDPGVTTHMAMDDSILSMNKNSSSCFIGMAGGKVVEPKRNGTSEVLFPGGTGPINLDHVLNAPMITRNLVPIPCWHDNGHTIQCTKSSCAVKM